jgi:hypothetical protein
MDGLLEKLQLFPPREELVHRPVRIGCQMRFEFLYQALCLTYPGTGLTGTHALIVPKLTVQRLDKLDTVPQRGIECMHGLVFQICEVVQTGRPMALPIQITLMTAIAGRLEKAVVWTVPLLDDPEQ